MSTSVLPSRARVPLVTLALGALLLLPACGESEQDDGAAQASGTAKTHMVEGIEFPVPEMSSVSMSAPGKGAIGLVPFRMAEKLGIWKKYGVDVKLHAFASDAQSLQALLAGQADVGGTSGGPALSSLTTNKPLSFVYVGRDNLTDVLASKPDIDSGEKLRGKSIAISSFGAQSHAGAVLAVEGLGLTADDVTITQVGDGARRLAALQSGAGDAAILDGIEMKTLESKGYHSLFRLADLGAGEGFIRSGIDVPTKFMDSNPNTTLALTAGLLEATTRTLDPANVEEVAKIWAEESAQPIDKAKEDVQAEFTPENYKPVDGRCTPELLDFMKDLLVSTNPKLERVDAKTACTNRFLDQLRDMGFTKAIGADGA
jgi:ABC-type nitrate/sulfonate/bicarbonate transport system substrate-binding protein